MVADGSAYSILGLEPGADATAVESAYRRLIKQHHPDREGGDAARAAEINRAYFELRKRRLEREREVAEAGLSEAIYERREQRHAAARQAAAPQRRRRRAPWGPVLIAALGGLLYLGREQVGAWRDDLAATLAPDASEALSGSASASASSLDEPLDEDDIQGAARTAVGMMRADDEEQLSDFSRQCYLRLRERPDVAALDRCAAFDDAIVALDRRDPMRGVEGPFGASAVTARQMAAASLLTNDYLAIEQRLDQIRSRVEAELAPGFDASGARRR